ncbi:MAG: hypothetical protein LBP59_18495 [Planctomycetaceae bacterium]|nr:hypothetical protein [Planctomycetaceae bacterium]
MLAFRLCSFRFAGETPAIRWSRLHFRIAGVLSAFILYFLLQKLSHLSLMSHLSLKNWVSLKIHFFVKR